MLTDNKIVHGLWVGDSLSSLEILCIKSFQKNGHEFWLWIYGPVQNVPDGTILKDATNIIPESEVFFYKNKNKFGHGQGSYAGFSDIFRYKLLLKNGGWWTDMDITCLKPMDFEEVYVFRHHHKTGVVGNLMKVPKESAIMAFCSMKAREAVNEDNQNWMLPIQILNEGVKKYCLEKYIISFTNQDSFPLIASLLKGAKMFDKKWIAIHWMNEEFRRLEIDKNTVLTGSILDKLFSEYKIQNMQLTGKNKMVYIWKLSRINYLILNLKSRINWYLKKIQKVPGTL